EYLTEWAVRDSSYRVLDLGTGHGKFVFAAYKQLVNLGASPGDAANQIYGTEIDSKAWSEFCELAFSKGVTFSHIHNEDFFDINIPTVNAVIGNPPWVRRSNIIDIESVRQKVMLEQHYSVNRVSRMADLYIYFLLHAIKFLAPGGNLAVVTADSW